MIANTAARPETAPVLDLPALRAVGYRQAWEHLDGAFGFATLRERGIFGGRDLSAAFPHLGQSALYCVTEVHTQSDLDRLASALAEVVA